MVIQVSGLGRFKNMGVSFSVAHLVLEEFKIGLDILRRVTVVSLQEFAGVFLHVDLRIPKQSGEQISS